MASMTVDSYIDIGTGGMHTKSSWQFAKDSEFTQIIDESLEDAVNVKKWHSPLPKREEDKSDPDAEEFYSDLDILYGRVKILVGETWSDWYVIGPRSQRLQRVAVTDNTGDEDIPEDMLEYVTDSTKVGWTDEVFDPEAPEILGPIITVPEDPDETPPTDDNQDSDTDQGTGEDTDEETGDGGDPLLPEYGDTVEPLPPTTDGEDGGNEENQDTDDQEGSTDPENGQEQAGTGETEQQPAPPSNQEDTTQPTQTKEELQQQFDRDLATAKTTFASIGETDPNSVTTEAFLRAIIDSGSIYTSLDDIETYFTENNVPVDYAGSGMWQNEVDSSEFLNTVNSLTTLNNKIRSM